MKNDIIIGADIYPTISNEELFKKANVEKLFGKDIISILKNSEARIFNLEGPFTDTETPISKSGPNHIADINCFNAIKAINPSVLCLANNHILDQGKQGLESTISLCKKNNILYCGIINEKTNNNKYKIITVNKRKVCLYACTEHEFSVTKDGTICSNPYDPLIVFDDIKKIKEHCDFVIVLYHGGREEYRYPTPNIRKIFRKFSDVGADIVINQHSHCIGCYEKYNDSYLVYGQGNFLFDADDNEYWNSGILLKINISKKINIEYIPLIKNKNTVKVANNEEAKVIINAFEERSRNILKDGYVDSKYNEYCRKLFGSYLVNIHGKSFYMKLLNKLSKGKIWKIIYRKKRYYALLNAIRCESHHEMLVFGIEEIL